MILEGVLDNSLGNFICLRGFAPLSDLAKISAPDPSYQRELIETHRSEMIKFLNDQKFLFFPEVILGASLTTEADVTTATKLILGYEEKQSVTYHFDQFKLSYKITTRKSPSGDIRSKIRFRRALLTLNDGDIDSGNLKFHRVDGNHRLSVLDGDEELDEGIRQRFADYNVPFCIVLFRNDTDLQEYSRALFHNINFRQVALTMEQSLKLIIEDKDLFSDETLSGSFGESYLLTRKMLSGWDLSMLQNIKAVIDVPDPLKCTKRTFLLNTFDLLLTNNLMPESDAVDEFKKHLAAVNSIYEDTRLGQNSNAGLLAAFVYYAFKATMKLKVFTNWVIENHIYQTETTDAKGLIKIFDCVLESKKRTVFISMQFSEDTSENYKAIKGAIDDVNNGYNLDIGIQEIRIDKLLRGHSYRIDEEILRLIGDSGFLIADLTHGNKNVYHEVGFLMGVNKGAGLPQDNFIFVLNKQIGKFDEDVGFNLKAHQVLVADGTNDLRTKLKRQIATHFGLME